MSGEQERGRTAHSGPRLYDWYTRAAGVFGLLVVLTLVIPAIMHWNGHWPRNRALTLTVNITALLSLLAYLWFWKLGRKYA